MIPASDAPTGGPDVALRIEMIRDRARRRYLRFLLIYPFVWAFGMTAVDVVDSKPDLLEELLTRVVIVAIVVVILALLARRRRPGVWTPRLTWGLPTTQRRMVNRDLRQGRPSSDPVLREVELLTARRMQGPVHVSVWLLPVCIVLACPSFIVARGGGEVTLVALLVTALSASWIYQLRVNRGLRAFVR